MRYSTVWTDAAVTKITDVAAKVRLFDIEPGAIPFRAGAHLDVSVMIHDAPEIRSYSLVGVYQAKKPYRIAVKRLLSSRGGSDYMWSLKPGARLSISQPKNHFEMTFGRESYLLIAGGIGITPIYGMALELSQRGAEFHLLYAASCRAEMPFLDELQQKLGARLSIFPSDEGQRIDIPRVVGGISAGTQIYICAPLRMLDAVRAAWNARGLPEADLRYETFAASGKFAPQPFAVSIPRFGVELTVAENQTLLDALTEAGIEVMADCLRGECGLCTVDILSCSGEVDHRDFFFSEHQKGENRKLCACVSRVVNGRLVMDTAYRGRHSRTEN
jgi:vanillate O-demethylase ferredoxin subunit